MLLKRGYSVEDRTDKNGQHILDVHHFGEGSHLRDALSEMGLVKGTLHSITHPAVALSDTTAALKRTGDYVKGTLTDPARANGLVYITAEVFLTLAGLGNKETGKVKSSFWQRIKQPRNFFQSLAGAFFLCQSITFFAFARSNEDQALDAIKKKTNHQLKSGTTPENMAFNAEQDGEHKGLGSTISKFVQKYPIQIGAVFNDLGMLAYLGHTWYNRKYHLQTPHLPESKRYLNGGFARDIGGAITSLVAWTFLLIPSKKKENNKDGQEQKKADSNPISGVINHFKENPEHATGLLTVASSTQRLMGGISKRNTMQVIGESIYLPGDFFLLFTKNGEYGSSDAHDTNKLAKHLAEHFNGLPAILGAEAQLQTVTSAANFLRDKAMHENANHHNSKAPSPQVLDARAKELAHATLRMVKHVQNEKLEELADISAQIVEKFPATQQQEAAANLTHALTQLPWIRASEQELQTLTTKALSQRAANSAPVQPIRTMRDVSHEVSRIVSIVPGIQTGDSAGIIHDAIAPLLQTQAPSSVPGTVIRPQKIQNVTETLREAPAPDGLALNPT